MEPQSYFPLQDRPTHGWERVPKKRGAKNIALPSCFYSQRVVKKSAGSVLVRLF